MLAYADPALYLATGLVLVALLARLSTAYPVRTAGAARSRCTSRATKGFLRRTWRANLARPSDQREKIMSNSLSENKDAWTAEMLRLRREIMHDPCAHAVITLAEHMFREYDTEIARLKAGLDEIKGTSVVHFYETAMSADTLADIPHLLDEYYASEPTGTIARATDTGREWVKLTLGWMAV